MQMLLKIIPQTLIPIMISKRIGFEQSWTYAGARI